MTPLRATLLPLCVVLGVAFWAACDQLPTRDLDAASELRAKPGNCPGNSCGGDGGGGGGETTPETIVTLTDDASHNIRSDGRGDYVGGACGVLADFNLRDARLDPDANYRGKHRKSCADPRALVFEWDDPDDGGAGKITRVDGIFMNIDQVKSESGTDVLHMGQFNLCNRLIFNPNDGSAPGNGSDLLLVSFDDGGTPGDESGDSWTVRTQDYPNDKGYCVGDGRLWHMPFELRITLQ